MDKERTEKKKKKKQPSEYIFGYFNELKCCSKIVIIYKRQNFFFLHHNSNWIFQFFFVADYLLNSIVTQPIQKFSKVTLQKLLQKLLIWIQCISIGKIFRSWPKKIFWIFYKIFVSKKICLRLKFSYFFLIYILFYSYKKKAPAKQI